MLLRKPLGRERHKGGTVFESGDDAYNCITYWLTGKREDLEFAACSKAPQ
jgi:hypothetical protein